MTIVSFRRCLYLILVSFWIGFVQDGHGLQMTITPTRFTGDNGATVEMGCHLDDREVSAREVMLMKIAKKGEYAIVLLLPGNNVTLETADKDRMTAVGKIRSNIQLSYLNLTLTDPEIGDSGQYSCVIDYIDVNGELIEDTISGYLTVDDPKLNEIKKTFDKLVHRLDAQEQELQLLKDHRLKNDELQLATLSLQTTKQDEEIDELKKDDTQVAFSAHNDNNLIWMQVGKTIIFPTVGMAIGGGYDPKTGVFTAPLAGLYVFSLTVRVGCKDCGVTIELKLNDDVIDALLTGDKDLSDQTSTSTVVRLKAGDKVKSVVKKKSTASFLINGKFCIFSGFRIGS